MHRCSITASLKFQALRLCNTGAEPVQNTGATAHPKNTSGSLDADNSKPPIRLSQIVLQSKYN